jgi:UDP:flavonoid glycosyltransferase YjiC (YdhE family)
MAKVEFAWELGAGTGHVTTLLPIAAAMKARGHEVRFGAGLGIAPEVPNADYASALGALAEKAQYAEKAREFAGRYARHEKGAALATMIARIEAALG